MKVDFRRLQDLDEVDWRLASYGKTVGTLRILELVESLRGPGQNMLDLGCGGGGLTQLLDDYTGADRSPEAIATARRLARGVNVHFLQADISDVPLPDAVADLVISVHLLEHVANPEAALREIHRLTRRRAMVVMPCRDLLPFFHDPINWLRLRLGVQPRPTGAFGYGHISIRTRASWLDLMERTGFRVIAVLPYDTSLISHVEFFLFSLFTSKMAYEDLPIRTLDRRVYRWIQGLHRMAARIDIDMPTSFIQCFVLDKVQESGG